MTSDSPETLSIYEERSAIFKKYRPLIRHEARHGTPDSLSCVLNALYAELPAQYDKERSGN